MMIKTCFYTGGAGHTGVGWMVGTECASVCASVDGSSVELSSVSGLVRMGPLVVSSVPAPHTVLTLATGAPPTMGH